MVRGRVCVTHIHRGVIVKGVADGFRHALLGPAESGTMEALSTVHYFCHIIRHSAPRSHLPGLSSDVTGVLIYLGFFTLSCVHPPSFMTTTDMQVNDPLRRQH